MKPTYEVRVAKGIEIREAPKDSGHIAILAGIAAPFDSDSVRFRGWEKDWIERIDKGAFTRTLAENMDVYALYSHDSTRPIARTPDTLALSVEKRGLAFSLSLVDTQDARDLLTQVRAKIIDGMSFGFEAVKTQWIETPDLDTRTLLDVNLFEVSPTIWNAYPDSTIGLRSHKLFREARAEAPDLVEIMEERSKFLSAVNGTIDFATQLWGERVRFL